MTEVFNPAVELGDAAVKAARIVEGVVGNAWATDASGRFTYVSPSSLAPLGVMLDEVRGSPEDGESLGWKRFIHADDYEEAAAAWRRCMQSGEPYNVEHRMLRSTGVYSWGRCSGQALRDDHGRITGWYGALLSRDEPAVGDVHEALREREREFSLLVDMVPVNIARMAPNGEPTFFSKRTLEAIGAEDISAWDRADMSRLAAIMGATLHPEDAPRMKEVMQRAIAAGEPWTIKYRRRGPDGAYRWMEGRAEPLRDESGSILQWYSAAIDIDDQMRSEEALRRSELKLRQLIDTVPAPIWGTTPDGEPCYINKPLSEFCGISLDHLDQPDRTKLASAIAGAVHPDDSDVVGQALHHSFTTGEPFAKKYRHRRADGDFRWVDGRAEPLRDQDGRILQWYGVCLDIDEEVRAQQALRERERELSQIISMVPSHVWRLTPEGEPTFYNTRMADFIGLAVDETGNPGASGLRALVEMVHPDDAAPFEASLHHSLATGESFAMQYRLRRADGQYRWMSGRAEPLRNERNEIVQWFGLCHDIDDQMRLYSEVAEREAQIRRLVDSDVIGIVVWDLDGTLIDANDAFLRMVQYERSDVEAGLRWLDMTPPDWQAVHAQEEAEELATTGKMQAREKEYFRKDGTRVPILIGAAHFEGQSQQGVAFILDLTERKQAEQALRESERALKELVETLPVMIDCAAPDGEPVFRSGRLREFLGYNLEDLQDSQSRLEATLDSGVHPDDLAGVKEHYARCLATGEPYARRHRLRRFDGEYRWVETRAAPMRNAEGAIVQWNVICLDIDAEVRGEEQLRLAQGRLARASQAASLAELSASIAHEVNQPLAAVVANSHACQRWLNADPPNLPRAQTTVERIIRDANSAADVVSRIRALFRQNVETRSVSTLGAVIAEVHDLMADTVRKAGVTVEAQIDPLIPEIEFDPVQIQQVLINLTRNAIEAMEMTAGPKVLRLAVRQVGDAVRFEVADTGPGVEHPEQVLDPFYTTKEDGLGMGLAIARSIVESHGGSLWFDPNPSGGSTFSFTLPIQTSVAS
jgi:PAS domain S-box-containing protein